MKLAILVIIIVTSISLAEGFKTHAITLSAGVPGLLIPEISYEFSFDSRNKLGFSAGTFIFWPEYRLSYFRMIDSFELAGSIGYVPDGDAGDGTFIDDLFSGGTAGSTFVSTTAGYRYSARSGFIFRLAGGAGYFFNSDETDLIPFFQIGLGYGFNL